MSALVEKYKSIKDAIDRSVEGFSTFDDLAADVLTRVVIETINTYQQKLNVGVQDSVGDLVDSFKQKVSQAIFETSSGWHVANRDAALFPRGCRFCYTRGDTTLVVVEQEPQIRSLMFSEEMLGESQGSSSGGAGVRVALALPYVIFIVQFKRDRFTNLYCCWRTAPLRTLDEPLIPPLLPNIHDNFNVCLGRSFAAEGSTIAEICDSVISNFWNSQFNGDLSTHWWGKARINAALQTALTWQDHSAHDSMFILNVAFPYNPERILRYMVEHLTLHEQLPDENALRHKLSDAIDEAVEALFSKVVRYFKKTKFERHHPKEVKAVLGAAMKEACVELADLISVINQECEKLGRQLVTDGNKTRYEKRGAAWAAYCS